MFKTCSGIDYCKVIVLRDLVHNAAEQVVCIAVASGSIGSSHHKKVVLWRLCKYLIYPRFEHQHLVGVRRNTIEYQLPDVTHRFSNGIAKRLRKIGVGIGIDRK